MNINDIRIIFSAVWIINIIYGSENRLVFFIEVVFSDNCYSHMGYLYDS